MVDTTISIRIDKGLKEKMEMHDYINWSALIRRLLTEEIKKYQEKKKNNIKNALEEIKKIRQSRIFDGGKSSVEVIREWRDKRKF